MGLGRSKNAARPLLFLLFAVLPAVSSVAWAAGAPPRLGARGDSLDAPETDPPPGKMAGAFFASAATEDEIIPRLADLAAEISEKLFGVKTAARTYPTPLGEDQKPCAA